MIKVKGYIEILNTFKKEEKRLYAIKAITDSTRCSLAYAKSIVDFHWNCMNFGKAVWDFIGNAGLKSATIKTIRRKSFELMK